MISEHVKASKALVKSPSPVTYKKEHSFDATQSPNIIRHQFTKTVKRNFIEEANTKKKNWPGVGKYNPDKSIDNAITIGARRGWK